jgi:hypothetical protein
VVTDNSRVFWCKQLKDVCFRWGITHITTTPYNPQASLAEPVNCNLKSALKIFHHESQSKWDAYLPWLALSFNTAVHESTKNIPDKLCLGRELRCPLPVRWDLSPEGFDNAGDSNQLYRTHPYKNSKLARSKVTSRYNANRRPHRYEVGDTVVFRLNVVSSKAQNISAKMLMRWSKPMVVSKLVGHNTIFLVSPDTGVIGGRAHVSQVKAYIQ